MEPRGNRNSDFQHELFQLGDRDFLIKSRHDIFLRSTSAEAHASRMAVRRREGSMDREMIPAQKGGPASWAPARWTPITTLHPGPRWQCKARSSFRDLRRTRRRVRDYKGIVRGITVRAPDHHAGDPGRPVKASSRPDRRVHEMCEQTRQSAYDLMVAARPATWERDAVLAAVRWSEVASRASGDEVLCYGTAVVLE